MDPMWLLVITAGGSCVAALASAGMAIFSYRTEQERAARAELYVRVEHIRGPIMGPAEVDLRLWNDGQGTADAVELSAHPTGAASIGTEPTTSENSNLPEQVGPGDEFPARVELPLSGVDTHTLILSWKDSGTGQRRHRYSILDPRNI